jgi:peptide/nickel transport system ATP-binding protein
MLSVQNLSVVYRQGKHQIPAAMDVSFSLAAGESLGIIGESGCGKTTLALGIMGLVRGTSIDGLVLFQGQDLNVMKNRERRCFRWRHIAMVFQNSLEVFNPVTTLGEQLTEPLTTHLGLSRKAAHDRVSEMLTLTGLDPHWHKAFAHQLSGGMRQRALIAMALSCEPDILIIDEPTTSLDPDSRLEILDLIESLQQSLGFAMILISHNLPAIQRLTSRLLTMYAGRVIEEGATTDILSNPLHPYTRGLINSAPDFFPYKDLWGIRGMPPRIEEISGCSFSGRCCQVTEQCTKSRPDLQNLGHQRRVACHKGGIETLLEAAGIKKTYSIGKKVVKALHDVNLLVRRGEVVALVGKSGSGKSTLAHVLVNVLQADEGQVRFCNRLVKNREATSMIGGIQMVFQDPGEAISHRLSVLDAVREPLNIMGWRDHDNRHERAVEVLSAMHLPTTIDFLQRTCHSLSGGQQQRVAIARALATEPSLLVADEITAMLDPSTQAVILRELKGQQHQRGFSMLFITHNIHLARKIADRVYVLDQGFMVEEGAAFEVFSDQYHSNSKELLTTTSKN